MKLVFHLEKQVVSKVLFREQKRTGEPIVVNTFYMTTWVWERMGEPQTLEITIGSDNS